MSEREELAKWADQFARLFGPGHDFGRNMARIVALLREPHALPEKPPEGFVRVRAAVAVGESGGYYVSGWTERELGGWREAGDDEMNDHASDNVGDGAWRVSFVTFDAPMPTEPAEIVGKIA